MPTSATPFTISFLTWSSAASYLKFFCAQASVLYGKSQNFFKVLNKRSAPQDNIFMVVGFKNKKKSCHS